MFRIGLLEKQLTGALANHFNTLLDSCTCNRDTDLHLDYQMYLWDYRISPIVDSIIEHDSIFSECSGKDVAVGVQGNQGYKYMVGLTIRMSDRNGNYLYFSCVYDPYEVDDFRLCDICKLEGIKRKRVPKTSETIFPSRLVGCLTLYPCDKSSFAIFVGSGPAHVLSACRDQDDPYDPKSIINRLLNMKE